MKKILLMFAMIVLLPGCLPVLNAIPTLSTNQQIKSEPDSSLIETKNSGTTQLSRIYNSGTIYIGVESPPETKERSKENISKDPIGPNLLTVLEERIGKNEGLELFPYQIAPGRPLHIGYGRNLTDRGISKPEAMAMRRRDIIESIQDLQIIFPAWQSLPIDVQIVLGEMRYQLGPGGFRRFNNLIASVKEQNWQQMIFEMYGSKWYEDEFTHARAEMLINNMKDFINKTGSN